jgi:hypothetical protein
MGVAAERRERVLHAAATPEMLHGLWTLEGLEALDDEVLLVAIESGREDVTAAALKILMEYQPRQAGNFAAPLQKLLSDGAPALEVYLAAALGNNNLLPDGNGQQLLATLLRENPADTLLAEAALSGLTGREEDFRQFLETGGPTPQPITQMLLATIERKRYLAEHPPTPGSNNDDRTAGWQLSSYIAAFATNQMGRECPALLPHWLARRW